MFPIIDTVEVRKIPYDSPCAVRRSLCITHNLFNPNVVFSTGTLNVIERTKYTFIYIYLQFNISKFCTPAPYSNIDII